MSPSARPHAARWRATLRFALVPAVAVALVTAALLAIAHALLTRQIEARALDRTRFVANDLALRIDGTLRSMQREVALLARSPALDPSRPPEALRQELEYVSGRDPRFVWIGLVAMDGRVLAATRGWLEGVSIAKRPVFAQAREAAFVGDLHAAVALARLMTANGVPAQELLDIGEPVRDADGRVLAVLAAHVGVGWVHGLRDETVGRIGGSAREALQMYVLSVPGARSVMPDESPPVGLPARVDPASSLQSADGEHWFGATAGVGLLPGQAPLLPWRVLALQPRAAAMAASTQLIEALAAFGLLAACVVGGAGVLLSRRMLRPWSPMFDAVLARTDGAPDARSVADAVADALRAQADTGVEPSGVERLLGRLARGAQDLRRVIDHLPFGVALIDGSFRVQYLNPGYTRLLGWTTEQVRGHVAAEFLFDAAERAEFVRLFQQFGDTPGECAARFDALCPDGSRVAIQWHFVPFVEDGRFEGALAIVSDIRAERAARARAEAMAGRLRALADAAVDQAIVTLDAEGRVLEWSRGAECLTGRPSALAIGEPLEWLLPPADPVLHKRLATCMLSARRDGHCLLSFESRTVDGRLRCFDGALYPLGLAPGSARFGLLLRDTTDDRATTRALEHSEARLRLALQAATMGTWDIDLADPRRPVRWSDGYDRTFGLRAEDLPPDDDALHSLVHPADRETLRNALRGAVRDDAPLAVEFRIRPPSGERWHAIVGRALRGPDGRAYRLIGVGMDVSARRAAEQALRESEERLVRIVDTMSEGLVMLDADGRYTVANPAAARIVGVARPSDIVGLHYTEAPWRRAHVDGREFGPSDHAHVRLRRGGADVHGEPVAMRRADGGRCVVTMNATSVRDERGAFAGIVMTFVDVTERMAAEAARADSEARLAAIVEGASDAIVSTDADGRVQRFNPAAERVFGVRAADMLGRTLDRLLPPAARAGHAGQMSAFSRSGVSQRAMGVGRIQGLNAEGRMLALDASISQTEVGGQRVLTAILRDVTERAAHEQMLENTRSELAALTVRLLAQEKETTRRLAQALHDELGQTLTALRLHWEAMVAPGQEPVRADAIRDRIGTLLVTANRQIRHVLGELRPPMLDEFGLVAALDNEVRQQQPADESVALSLEIPLRLQQQRWPADVEYAAFMVGREALGNALYHAAARDIRVQVEGDEGELWLTVRDDGVGIGEADLSGRPGHLGLVGMRERALAIGAELHIGPPPEGGAGTTVTLHWTLSDEPHLPG